MKNKYGIIILTILFLMVYDHFFTLSYSNQGKTLEIFVEGKRYSSFYDYKLKRLKASLRMSFFSSEFDDFSSFKKNVLNNYAKDKYEGVSKEDLSDVLDEMSSVKLKDTDAGLVDMKQMQGMLDNYNKHHKKTGSIIIDPDKMKTIIINPAGKTKMDTE